jgi:microcystin-dependent protein
MTDPYVGQLQLFGFNFAPAGWALCEGQVLPISQNPPLFSILGTNFGGNGTSTFGLPNLQGRIAVGAGQGLGLSNYAVGETVGTTTVTLTTQTMPMHNHGLMASLATGSAVTVTGNQLGLSTVGGGKGGGGTVYTSHIYSPNASKATTGLAQLAIGLNGGGQPHNNMQPYLTLNYCIALRGVFPPRN